MKGMNIYLDHASLTPVDKRVIKKMNAFMKGDFANPSSLYKAGVAAKKALESARASVAQFFHAHADEIVFTASGTEANNIAVIGVVEHLVSNGKSYKDIHIVVSAIEHASVLEAAHAFARKGVQLDIIPVTEAGIIDMTVFKKSLRPTTALVSVMMVNNEIGTIQPIHDIVKAVRDFKKNNLATSNAAADSQYPLVHTDACQALLYMDINLEKMGVDMLTADAHKIYGPRGMGMLYVRRSAGKVVAPIMYGGGQENGLRPGTENVAGCAGIAAALEIIAKENSNKKETETARIVKLRDYVISQLVRKIPGLVVNGDLDSRIANNVNISIPGIDHEFLLLQLDARGIACSTKSSCLRDEDESYVIRALRKDSQLTANALRFSLGRSTSKKGLDYLIKSIDECIHL